MADGNLLDSFFVSLGWDTRDFKRGQGDIEQGFKKTGEAARKQANAIEADGKRAGLFFRSLRNEVVGFTAAVIGFRSAGSFVANIIGSDADMSRLSRNVDVAIGKVAGLRGAVRAMGGNDADADSALSAMSKAFQSYQLTGTTGNDADFQGLGVSLADLQNPMTALLKISEASERMSKPEFVARLQRIGLPQSVINSLEKGRAGFAALVDQNEKLANITKEDGKQAEEFQKQLAELETKITGVVRPAVTELIKELIAFVDTGGDITRLNPLVVGALGAIGLAVVAATGEWVALGLAIAGVVKLWDWALNESPMSKYLNGTLGMGASNQGDAGAGWSTSTNSAGETSVTSSIGAPSGKGGGAGVAAQYNRLVAKYGKFRADAIWHGIGAESGWNPTASLKDATGETYGLGQWRGNRLKGLRAKYGNTPSAADQISYLMWELDGGDGGGASVLNSRSYGEALSNYIGLSAGRNSFGFMRPSAGGRAGDLQRARQLAGLPTGAGPSAAGGAGNTTNVGTIVVNVPSGDPETIARELPRAIRKRGLVVQTGSGMHQ